MMEFICIHLIFLVMQRQTISKIQQRMQCQLFIIQADTTMALIVVLYMAEIPLFIKGVFT